MRTLLHISDVHFGPYHQPDRAAAIETLVRARRPDLVVISGDLTQRAKRRQFDEARAFVDRLQAEALPVLAVPGNHDVPLYRVWERVFAPYGMYRARFDATLEPEFEDDALLAIGLNTAYGWTLKDGRLRRRRLRALRDRLARANAGKLKIIVAHHPLVPAPRYDTQRVVYNAHEAATVFADAGVDLVLSGHLHQTFVTSTEAYYPSGRAPVLLVNTGTTTSSRGRGVEHRRNTCNWLRLDAQTVDITQLGWDDDAADFVPWSRQLHPRQTAGASAPARLAQVS
ncbi:MAG: metallophosphoesterase family protein [Acidobacteriota bacterium]